MTSDPRITSPMHEPLGHAAPRAKELRKKCFAHKHLCMYFTRHVMILKPSNHMKEKLGIKGGQV